MQKEKNEIDLSLFFDLVEKYKVLCNQTPVDTLNEDMEKMQNGVFTKCCFNLVDEKDIETNRFFQDSIELTKLVDKVLDRYDDHPSIYNTGDICRYFRNFKPVNRSEHGRSANIKRFYWKMEHKTVIYQVEMDALSYLIHKSSKENIPKNVWNSYTRINGELML